MPREYADSILSELEQLEAPTPRKPRLKPPFEVPGLWAQTFFMVFLQVFSAYLIVTMLWPPVLTDLFGFPAQATVTQKWVQKVATRTGGVFEVPELEVKGDGSGGALTVSSEVYASAAVGQKVDIRYLPWFSNQPLLANNHPGIGEIIFDVFVLIVWIYFVFDFITGVREQKFLLIHGKPIRATIYAAWKNNFSYRFAYGQQTYKNSFISYRWGKDYETGDEIVILVNPDKPQSNGYLNEINFIGNLALKPVISSPAAA